MSMKQQKQNTVTSHKNAVTSLQEHHYFTARTLFYCKNAVISLQEWHHFTASQNTDKRHQNIARKYQKCISVSCNDNKKKEKKHIKKILIFIQIRTVQSTFSPIIIHHFQERTYFHKVDRKSPLHDSSNPLGVNLYAQ